MKKDVEMMRKWLTGAEAVVIGAGAGLSSSAGFTYTGERFDRYFSDFAKKYGFRDMYSGGIYPYPSLEEFWAYWSRYVYINRYDQPAGKPYETLLRLVQGKNYFVLTTNVDHRFQVRGSRKGGCFIRRAITGCSNAVFPDTKRRTKTKNRCARCWRGRKI